MKDHLMLIGELAEFFGISRKAIRLYEKKGIIKPAQVDEQTGYRHYAAELLLNALTQKQQAWQEAMEAARYKSECLENIIKNLQNSRSPKRLFEMTEEERAWFLVKMVCIEDIRAQKALSEALWL